MLSSLDNPKQKAVQGIFFSFFALMSNYVLHWQGVFHICQGELRQPWEHRLDCGHAVIHTAMLHSGLPAGDRWPGKHLPCCFSASLRYDRGSPIRRATRRIPMGIAALLRVPNSKPVLRSDQRPQREESRTQIVTTHSASLHTQEVPLLGHFEVGLFRGRNTD